MQRGTLLLLLALAATASASASTTSVPRRQLLRQKQANPAQKLRQAATKSLRGTISRVLQDGSISSAIHLVDQTQTVRTCADTMPWHKAIHQVLSVWKQRSVL